VNAPEKPRGKSRFDTIGKPRRRVDGRAKAIGQLKFADDLALPRMLHCKLLRSPHPHAAIESIDVSRAEAHPGVHLVLTGEAFAVPYGIMPVSQDEHALARGKVRFVGDPVAAVIAVDEHTAVEALGLIDVKYQPLGTVGSAEEGLANPEPRIHDYGERGNIHRNQSYEFGDVERALKDSAHVFEDLFFYEGNTHLPMEQQASLASIEGDGKLLLQTSTQNPHYLHRQLARVLQVPAAHIRVIATPNGGGFGGKCDPGNHEFVVAKAALILGRPVKICLTREEVFYQHRGRHPVLMKFRTGVGKDGRLTAMHLQTVLDGGAYGSHGPASTFYTGVLTPVTYELPRFKFDACRVFTNKPACGPKRGHGTPQPRFGQEVQLERSPRSSGSTRRSCASRWSPSPTRSPRAGCAWARPGWPSASARSSRCRGGRSAAASSGRGAASDLRARRTCAARACRSTGTRCRTRRCSCCSIAAARSPCTAARPSSGRARTTCSPG